LVVIGILIALQINNWNEFRKERKLERKLLSEVMVSIKSDTSSLNFERERFERIIHHAKLIREKIDNDEPYKKSLDSSFAIINTFLIQEADYKAYERIKSVGLEIITNEDIEKGLSWYYNQSKFLWNFEKDRIGDIFMRKIYPKYFKKYAYDKYAIPKDFESLKTESEFLIHLDYCINDANYYKANSITRKKVATRLLKKLEKELNK